jgi:U3 small nucleolar RNA-associated protein 25
MARAFKSKAKKKTVKAPKGKKARAKAKLDRHWGELVNDDEIRAAKYRKGRSRLVLKSKSSGRDRREMVAGIGEGPRFENMKPGVDEYSSDDDDSDLDGSTNTDIAGALDFLMSRIDGKKKISSSGGEPKEMHEGNEYEDTDTMDSEVGEKEIEKNSVIESDGEGEGSVGESDGDDDDIYLLGRDSDDETDVGRGRDGFQDHFSRKCLPEQEDALEKALIPSGKVKKFLGGTPHLDSNIEVTLSGDILEEAAGTKHSIDFFNELSRGYFQYVRQVLVKNWRAINARSLQANVDASEQDGGNKQMQKKLFSSLQTTIFPSLSSYADLQITLETRDNRHDIGNLLALHALNHVLTARRRVQRHNRRLKEIREKGEGDEGAMDEAADDERFRDSGFTRPKVLVLLPTRGTAYTFVNRIIRLMGDSASIDHMERFEAEYGDVEAVENDDDDDGSERRRKAILQGKGEDWKELFGDQANVDDDFKVGLSLTPNVAKRTKKAGNSGGISGKLYSDFYRSDIIFASPLALKMATSADDEEEEDKDRDYLSSIEVCLVLHADVMLMQNWDHVSGCLENINHQPTKSNDTDFSRVRNYFLAGQASFWRQLVFVSRFADPCLISSFKRHAQSARGRLKLRRKVSAEEASICDVLVPMRQVFQRVPCDSFRSQGDDRLNFFSEKVFPQLSRLGQKHTIIYIPSYFDFVAVRNLLLKKGASFVSVTEYARASEVSRGRARFVQGRKNLLLYTGRAHFFLRHTIKGARHLILFGLPEHPEFYPNLMNMLVGNDPRMEVDAPPSCLSLFTKYDAHALERITGTKNCERMVKGEKNTFLFSS